jgi:hypothetical protein
LIFRDIPFLNGLRAVVAQHYSGENPNTTSVSSALKRRLGILFGPTYQQRERAEFAFSNVKSNQEKADKLDRSLACTGIDNFVNSYLCQIRAAPPKKVSGRKQARYDRH